MMAQRYFPGSNTCRGFVGFFQDLLPRTEQARILLIKGGPGCGKSTLLSTTCAPATRTAWTRWYAGIRSFWMQPSPMPWSPS